jgi:hypothetical protein
MMANIFEDTWDAIRKYIIPPPLGGGYTEEEAKRNKEVLEEANKEVEANKGRNGGNYDPTEPFVEAVTGIPAELQNWQILLAGGLGIVIFLLIIKE